MITEDYVSVETAQLLKEKGYNGPSVFYDEEDAHRWNSENFIEVPNPNYDPSIPFDTETFRECLPHVTQAMAMKWLREVHNIHVVPKFDFYAGYYTGRIYDGRRESTAEKDDYIAIVGNSTYEEACEAAIKYCLENLI